MAVRPLPWLKVGETMEQGAAPAMRLATMGGNG